MFLKLPLVESFTLYKSKIYIAISSYKHIFGELKFGLAALFHNFTKYVCRMMTTTHCAMGYVLSILSLLCTTLIYTNARDRIFCISVLLAWTKENSFINVAYAKVICRNRMCNFIPIAEPMKWNSEWNAFPMN